MPRYLGVLLFGIGAVHPHEYLADQYRVIPTIGALFALGTIVGLLISDQDGPFGFHEYGHRTGFVLAPALEGAAVAVLLGFAALGMRPARRRPATDAG
ncbi:hypothetical protein [Actinomadura monticuli]|uniref:Uncharacterized protein n=1 Tax=Actinomadura monticuli TaxID=3097367 RepID=A0ABV4QI14_9ACTN